MITRRMCGLRSWTLAKALIIRVWFFGGESRPIVTNVTVPALAAGWLDRRSRPRASRSTSSTAKWSSSTVIAEVRLVGSISTQLARSRPRPTSSPSGLGGRLRGGQAGQLEDAVPVDGVHRVGEPLGWREVGQRGPVDGFEGGGDRDEVVEVLVGREHGLQPVLEVLLADGLALHVGVHVVVQPDRLVLGLGHREQEGRVAAVAGEVDEVVELWLAEDPQPLVGPELHVIGAELLGQPLLHQLLGLATHPRRGAVELDGARDDPRALVDQGRVLEPVSALGEGVERGDVVAVVVEVAQQVERRGGDALGLEAAEVDQQRLLVGAEVPVDGVGLLAPTEDDVDDPCADRPVVLGVVDLGELARPVRGAGRQRRSDRVDELGHGRADRARQVGLVQVEPAPRPVVVEVGDVVHDRPAGGEEVEEDRGVVGDQQVGHGQRLVGRARCWARGSRSRRPVA